jgi:hypothetical protein
MSIGPYSVICKWESPSMKWWRCLKLSPHSHIKVPSHQKNLLKVSSIVFHPIFVRCWRVSHYRWGRCANIGPWTAKGIEPSPASSHNLTFLPSPTSHIYPNLMDLINIQNSFPENRTIVGSTSKDTGVISSIFVVNNLFPHSTLPCFNGIKSMCSYFAPNQCQKS